MLSTTQVIILSRSSNHTGSDGVVRLKKLQLRQFRLSLKQQQLGEERLQGSPNGAIEIATGPGKADKLACFLVEGVRLASAGGP